MSPDDDDLTPDPQTAADDAADDAHTERWREERARCGVSGTFVRWIGMDGAEWVRMRADELDSLVERGWLIPGTPIFGCWVCGTPNESEPCPDHAQITTLKDLLEAARADERERAAGRVERVEGGYSVPLGASPGMVVDRMRQEFLAAIREGGA